MEADPAPRRGPHDPDAVRLRGWIDLAVGLVLFSVGAIVFVATRGPSTTGYIVMYAPLIVGALTALRGIWRLTRTPAAGTVPFGIDVAGGYKAFVAWRYLLVQRRQVSPVTLRLLTYCTIGIVAVRAIALMLAGVPVALVSAALLVFIGVVILFGVLRYSKVGLIICLFGLLVLGIAVLGMWYFGRPSYSLEPGFGGTMKAVSNGVAIGGGVLVFLAMFFGFLRAYFTFFTTVPIGGVWIGTAALVMVLAVMSGFESDLRKKILGSNAHIQLTREDGDFVEWRDVKAQVDRMPEVVASTPFAVSEVVIAANNVGQTVIIKGIDPKTVGKVTDLVSDLDDREAMKRLEPLIDDHRDLRVPQEPHAPSGPVVDPSPDDMPMPGEPIDFSSGGGGGAGGSAEPPSDAGIAHKARAGRLSRDDHALFGGDARKLIDLDVDPFPPGAPGGTEGEAPAPEPAPPAQAAVDPAPEDLITTDESPEDFSRPDYGADAVVRVIDVPFDTPSLSRRTQALPGILVGRELVKQTHMYTGEEVRVVSPLSDPSNPDATGTPIPFNRDYRVAGTFFTGMYEYDLKYVYVSLQSLQDFLDRGDAVDGIEIRVFDPDETDAFVAKLQRTFGPHYRVQDWKELNRSLFSALKLEKIAMFLVLGIVIMVASFSIVGNLIMVVQGKARQISLLKTLGASDVGVMQLFAIQGLMIGLIGTVLGVGTGLVLCLLGKRYGLPLNPDVYYIDRLPIHVDPMSVLAAASAGILISIFATLYPAVIAARVRPAAGLRH